MTALDPQVVSGLNLTYPTYCSALRPPVNGMAYALGSTQGSLSFLPYYAAKTGEYLDENNVIDVVNGAFSHLNNTWTKLDDVSMKATGGYWDFKNVVAFGTLYKNAIMNVFSLPGRVIRDMTYLATSLVNIPRWIMGMGGLNPIAPTPISQRALRDGRPSVNYKIFQTLKSINPHILSLKLSNPFPVAAYHFGVPTALSAVATIGAHFRGRRAVGTAAATTAVAALAAYSTSQIYDGNCMGYEASVTGEEPQSFDRKALEREFEVYANHPDSELILSPPFKKNKHAFLAEDRFFQKDLQKLEYEHFKNHLLENYYRGAKSLNVISEILLEMYPEQHHSIAPAKQTGTQCTNEELVATSYPEFMGEDTFEWSDRLQKPSNMVSLQRSIAQNQRGLKHMDILEDFLSKKGGEGASKSMHQLKEAFFQSSTVFQNAKQELEDTHWEWALKELADHPDTPYTRVITDQILSYSLDSKSCTALDPKVTQQCREVEELPKITMLGKLQPREETEVSNMPFWDLDTLDQARQIILPQLDREEALEAFIQNHTGETCAGDFQVANRIFSETQKDKF